MIYLPVDALALTEDPNILFSRGKVKEEPTRSLEYSITEQSSDAFELRCQGIQYTRVEWRSFQDVFSILIEKSKDLRLRGSRKEGI